MGKYTEQQIQERATETLEEFKHRYVVNSWASEFPQSLTVLRCYCAEIGGQAHWCAVDNNAHAIEVHEYLNGSRQSDE